MRVARGRRAWRQGLRAEDAACAALSGDGWRILGRRCRTQAGEIDIVADRACARHGHLLAFIEVKARASLAEAAGALSARQQARLTAAASLLLAAHPDWMRPAIRFDLLLVDEAGRVRRIPDVIREEC